MSTKVRFKRISQEIPAGSGIYEILTDDGTSLKVGIGANLRQRLLQHRASLQSCLRLKAGGDWSNPGDVVSKRSILAKHLYYDRWLTSQYDLTSEADRRRFLEERCYIKFELTETREKARELERIREQHGRFRYSQKVRHL